MATRPGPPAQARETPSPTPNGRARMRRASTRGAGHVVGLAPPRPAGVRVKRPAGTTPADPSVDPSATYALIVDVPDIPDVPDGREVPGAAGSERSATFALVVDVPGPDPSGTFALVVDVPEPAMAPVPPSAPASVPASANGSVGPRGRTRPRDPARDHRPGPARTHPVARHTRETTRPAARPTAPPVAPGLAPAVVPGAEPPIPPGAEPATGAEAASGTRRVPPVDPRIHARRVAVQRAIGRRRLRVLVVLVGLLTVATALVAAVYSPMLDVERVDVAGVAPEAAAAVRQAAGVSRGDALLRVSPGKVEQRLEQLPWISHASVSRELPDTVHIAVSTRQTIAWVAVPPPKGSHTATTAALVDASGTIVSGVLVAPSGLPRLVGLTTTGRPGTRIAHAAAAHVAAILPADLRNLAATLSVRHGLVTMGLSGGPQIRFGTPDDLAAKGRTALALLGSLGKPVNYVDVRVPTAPVTG